MTGSGANHEKPAFCPADQQPLQSPLCDEVRLAAQGERRLKAATFKILRKLRCFKPGANSELENKAAKLAYGEIASELSSAPDLFAYVAGQASRLGQKIPSLQEQLIINKEFRSRVESGFYEHNAPPIKRLDLRGEAYAFLVQILAEQKFSDKSVKEVTAVFASLLEEKYQILIKELVKIPPADPTPQLMNTERSMPSELWENLEELTHEMPGQEGKDTHEEMEPGKELPCVDEPAEEEDSRGALERLVDWMKSFFGSGEQQDKAAETPTDGLLHGIEPVTLKRLPDTKGSRNRNTEEVLGEKQCQKKPDTFSRKLRSRDSQVGLATGVEQKKLASPASGRPVLDISDPIAFENAHVPSEAWVVTGKNGKLQRLDLFLLEAEKKDLHEVFFPETHCYSDLSQGYSDLSGNECRITVSVDGPGEIALPCRPDWSVEKLCFLDSAGEDIPIPDNGMRWKMRKGYFGGAFIMPPRGAQTVSYVLRKGKDSRLSPETIRSLVAVLPNFEFWAGEEELCNSEAFRHLSLMEEKAQAWIEEQKSRGWIYTEHVVSATAQLAAGHARPELIAASRMGICEAMALYSALRMRNLELAAVVISGPVIKKGELQIRPGHSVTAVCHENGISICDLTKGAIVPDESELEKLSSATKYLDVLKSPSIMDREAFACGLALRSAVQEGRQSVNDQINHKQLPKTEIPVGSRQNEELSNSIAAARALSYSWTCPALHESAQKTGNYQGFFEFVQNHGPGFVINEGWRAPESSVLSALAGHKSVRDVSERMKKILLNPSVGDRWKRKAAEWILKNVFTEECDWKAAKVLLAPPVLEVLSTSKLQELFDKSSTIIDALQKARGDSGEMRTLVDFFTFCSSKGLRLSPEKALEACKSICWRIDVSQEEKAGQQLLSLKAVELLEKAGGLTPGTGFMAFTLLRSEIPRIESFYKSGPDTVSAGIISHISKCAESAEPDSMPDYKRLIRDLKIAGYKIDFSKNREKLESALKKAIKAFGPHLISDIVTGDSFSRIRARLFCSDSQRLYDAIRAIELCGVPGLRAKLNSCWKEEGAPLAVIANSRSETKDQLERLGPKDPPKPIKEHFLSTIRWHSLEGVPGVGALKYCCRKQKASKRRHPVDLALEDFLGAEPAGTKLRKTNEARLAAFKEMTRNMSAAAVYHGLLWIKMNPELYHNTNDQWRRRLVDLMAPEREQELKELLKTGGIFDPAETPAFSETATEDFIKMALLAPVIISPGSHTRDNSVLAHLLPAMAGEAAFGYLFCNPDTGSMDTVNLWKGMYLHASARAGWKKIWEKALKDALVRSADALRGAPERSMHSNARLSEMSPVLAKAQSGDFDFLREYKPGDDIRQIDWRATGRSEKLFVKEKRDREERPLNLVVDAEWLCRENGTPNKGKLARVFAILRECADRKMKIDLVLARRSGFKVFEDLHKPGKLTDKKLVAEMSDFVAGVSAVHEYEDRIYAGSSKPCWNILHGFKSRDPGCRTICAFAPWNRKGGFRNLVGQAKVCGVL